MTVASSGEGATLDGQRLTGLFYLNGGRGGRCSLTLRGLSLVNARARHGAVVSAYDAGVIEIIESRVMGCSAEKVCLVA